jgi:hypothetical protein
MTKIALASAVMIFLSLIAANEKVVQSGRVLINRPN